MAELSMAFDRSASIIACMPPAPISLSSVPASVLEGSVPLWDRLEGAKVFSQLSRVPSFAKRHIAET